MKKNKSKFDIMEYDLKVKRAQKGSGLGLFASCEIPKGECIAEYKGRQITEEEKYTSNSKYLFEINSKITIDGTDRKNKARYINHSCKPNCEVLINKSRIFIFTTKKIKSGEEITYDYGEEYYNDYIKPIGCKCIKCQSIK